MRFGRASWPITLFGVLAFLPLIANAQTLPEPTTIDQKFAVLGIVVGQTPEQVTTALKTAYPNAFVADGKQPPPANGPLPDSIIEFNRQMDPVSGKPYTATITAAIRGGLQLDRTDVNFSAPASGNRAFSVLRSDGVPGEAKTALAPLVKSLVDRYGPAPVSATVLPPSSDSVFAKWSFDPTGKMLPPGTPYANTWCFAQGSTEIRNGEGCGSVEFSWKVETYGDHAYASFLYVRLIDGQFMNATRAYDAAVAKKAHDEEVERANSKDSDTKL